MVSVVPFCEDAAMGNGRVTAAVFAACGLLGGCGVEPAAAGNRDDVLVLEVGGEQQSLRAALLSLGRQVDAPRRLRPVPPMSMPMPTPTPDVAESRDPEGQPPSPGEEPEPRPGPLPDAEPPSEWVVVELQKGETISHIAGRMLGSSRRFPEIMKWNGWDELDVRSLDAGVKVRLKRSELR